METGTNAPSNFDRQGTRIKMMLTLENISATQRRIFSVTKPLGSGSARTKGNPVSNSPRTTSDKAQPNMSQHFAARHRLQAFCKRERNRNADYEQKKRKDQSVGVHPFQSTCSSGP